jgi:NCAIR mutase (PurE)-related protein
MTVPVDENTLSELLARVAEGEVSPDQALADLQHLPYELLDEARMDHHREMRTGQVEAVYAPGKSLDTVRAATSSLVSHATGPVFVTRATHEQFDAVREVAPEAEWDERSGLIVAKRASTAPDAVGAGRVAVVSAGSSDIPVAEEAARTVEALGLEVTRTYDVGVAGLHRLIDARDEIEAADAVIVVAGMEGALPSVVSGMTSKPVVAVPTSVGYGAAFEGVAALLAMMTGCAPGVSVVNIDNGFGAAHVAHRLVRSARGMSARGAER